MRRAAAVLLLVLLPGCASLGLIIPQPETPREQLAAVEVVFTGLVGELAYLRESGEIGDDAWRSAKEAIREADSALDLAGEAIRDGDEDLSGEFLTLAQHGIRRLRLYVKEAKR